MGTFSLLTPRHFWLALYVAPGRFLSHRPERSAKKEGKEFVKSVDGLANVAGNRPGGQNGTRMGSSSICPNSATVPTGNPSG